MGTRAMLAGLCLALAAPAAAQPKGADKNIKQAAGLVKEAIAASGKGDHQAAIDLYLQAYLLVPNAVLLSNVGTEYEAAGKKTDALDYFCRYLAADANGTNATYATQRAKALARDLGRSEDAPCEAPKVVEPPPPPPETTTTTLPPPPPPPPAEHPGRTLRLAGLGVGVAGAAVFGIGVYYGIKGRSLSNQIDSHDPMKPWPTSIDGIPIADWDEKGKEFNRNQTIFMIAGAVTIAGGIALYFVGRSKGNHVEVAPTPSPSGGGLSLTGTF